VSFKGYQQDDNPLASYYQRFDVQNRCLFTGHSHQAWPDVAREAQLKAFDLAATQVDDKWGEAFVQADQLRSTIASLLGAQADQIALAQNTFELVYRWLSCFELKGLKLVTTDSEFHSIRRLREAMAQRGVEFVVVNSEPYDTFEERFIDALAADVSGALVSHTFFNSGYRLPSLANVAAHCDNMGISLLVDLYHTIGNSPFNLQEEGLENAFLVGGGYKYLQWGEGNCFMRVPPNTQLKPVFTGWFAEFDMLTNAPSDTLYYSDSGSFRFAGATYDITANLRANVVAAFFAEQGLTPETLHQSYSFQLSYLERALLAADLDPTVASVLQLPKDQRSCFLVLDCADAGALHQALAAEGVATDYRGSRLRFGPAPYLNTHQLQQAVEAVISTVTK